jgi:hypothetical protein
MKTPKKNFKFYSRCIREALGLRKPEYSKLHLMNELTLFAPGSAGSYAACADLTLQSAQQTFPFLVQLIKSLNIPYQAKIVEAPDFCQSPEDKASAEALKDLFNQYGSDKSQRHDYHHVYGRILNNSKSTQTILEIGLGTNNTDVVSNMGEAGKPGASLRAFRDFAPHAAIFGADIDQRILFEEERIKTYWVDQTDLSSFAELEQKIPNDADLIIDDGLHSPNANIAVILFALKKIRLGGWVVVEDILEEALPVWQVISALLPTSHQSSIIKCIGGYIFTIERLK